MGSSLPHFSGVHVVCLAAKLLSSPWSQRESDVLPLLEHIITTYPNSSPDPFFTPQNPAGSEPVFQKVP